MYLLSDINECLKQDVCGRNSDCMNTFGSYFCKCRPGYELDSRGECEGKFTNMVHTSKTFYIKTHHLEYHVVKNSSKFSRLMYEIFLFWY